MNAQYPMNRFNAKLKITDPIPLPKFVRAEITPRTAKMIDTIADHFCPLKAPLAMKMRRIPTPIMMIPTTIPRLANIPIKPPTAAVASAEPVTSTGADPNRLAIMPCRNRNKTANRNANTTPMMSKTPSTVPCQGRVGVSISEGLSVYVF